MDSTLRWIKQSICFHSLVISTVGGFPRGFNRNTCVALLFQSAVSILELFRIIYRVPLKNPAHKDFSVTEWIRCYLKNVLFFQVKSFFFFFTPSSGE